MLIFFNIFLESSIQIKHFGIYKINNYNFVKNYLSHLYLFIFYRHTYLIPFLVYNLKVIITVILVFSLNYCFTRQKFTFYKNS